MAGQISGTGDVAYLNVDFVTCKYNKYNVYVAASLLSKPVNTMKPGDFIDFKAKPYDAPTQLKNLHITHRATSASYKGRPKMYKTIGKIETVDKNGEFCFVAINNQKGDKETAFCTRVTYRPEGPGFHSIFKPGDQCRLVVKEQKGGANDVKFRGVIITDMKHAINDDYEVFPISQQPASKPTTASPAAVTRVVPSAMPDIIRSFSGIGLASPSNSPSRPLTADSVSSKASSVHVPSTLPGQPNPNADYSGTNPYSCYIPYDPCVYDFDEELRRLRIIAHYLTGYRCSNCLTN